MTSFIVVCGDGSDVRHGCFPSRREANHRAAWTPCPMTPHRVRACALPRRPGPLAGDAGEDPGLSVSIDLTDNGIGSRSASAPRAAAADGRPGTGTPDLSPSSGAPVPSLMQRLRFGGPSAQGAGEVARREALR